MIAMLGTFIDTLVICTMTALVIIIVWSYYGDRSAEYLFGKKAVLPYRIIYIVLVVVGASVPLQLVWNFADIANIFMAAPNLISLVLLAGVVKKLSDKYIDRGEM